MNTVPLHLEKTSFSYHPADQLRFQGIVLAWALRARVKNGDTYGHCEELRAWVNNMFHPNTEMLPEQEVKNNVKVELTPIRGFVARWDSCSKAIVLNPHYEDKELAASFAYLAYWLNDRTDLSKETSSKDNIDILPEDLPLMKAMFTVKAMVPNRNKHIRSFPTADLKKS